MRIPARPALAAALATLLPALAAAAPGRDDARPRDLQRLQQELSNLDEDLQGLDLEPARAQAFRERAEEIREDVVYLKVKMRRHQRSHEEGTGVADDEVAEVRQAVLELRRDLRQAARTTSRELRLREGTLILVRLDEALSSATARREDRFEASVFRPVRTEGGVAVPAGARLRGIVRDAQPAERPSREGRLELDFDVLYLDRERLDLRAEVTAVSEAGDERLDRGEKAGIGAVLGGILGGVLGGRKGAVLGAVLGGGGAVVGTKGGEVELPEGTIVTVRLTRPLVVPRL